MSEISPLAAAFWYAQHGIPVFPCAPRGKQPITEHGFHDATADLAAIREQWTREPRANIGVPTGSRSGWLVVDIDPRHGGNDTFDGWIRTYGRYPETAEAITGGGGRHVVFRHTDGLRCGPIGAGIDLKTDGGYIVVAPSVHPSGAEYRWDGIQGVKSVLSLAESPGWLLREARARCNNGKGSAAPAPGKIPSGRRNATLARLAGVVRRKGSSVEAINAYLQAENRDRCTRPLPDDEVRQIAESVCRYAPEENAPGDSASAGAASWRSNLIVNRDGKPKPILANAITALREAPQWAGVLAFNEFSLSTVATKPAPWAGAVTGAEWTDHEDRLAANWLQHQGVFVSVEIAGQAVQSVAKDRRFHPVREYLDGLKWDGTKRIDTWLRLYLGAEPNDYTAAVGARWLIAAVARIYQPGAKADCCLILEGPQGSKKSTALKTIAEPWFTDEIADLGSKDAAMQTRGVWVTEISELDSMSRSDVGKVKAFMSRSTDRFRPPYGKRLIESPRQCTFSGSVNHSNYLRDETGGRRFWPVACSCIRIDELARDRGQLWAEAVARYRGGSPWWLACACGGMVRCSSMWMGSPVPGVSNLWPGSHPQQVARLQEWNGSGDTSSVLARP